MPTSSADVKLRVVGSSAGVVDKHRDELTTSVSTNLVEGFRKFKRSAAPARFLFFSDGSWVDFVPPVLNALRDGFLAGRTTLEVPIDGAPHVVDFLRMTRVHMETGISSSIAWIDSDDLCFFPKTATDALPCQKLEIEIRIDRDSMSAVTSSKCSSDEELAAFEPTQERSDESTTASSVASLDRERWLGVQVVEQSDRYFRVIEKLFMAGIRRSVQDAVVCSIRKCLHAGPIGSSRLKAFQMQVQMTKAVRGEANLKFAWFGASARELTMILAHGFGQTNDNLLASDAHGAGVHLSAPCFPYSSALLSEPDANDERHVLLCRVIMGKPEKVAAGALQRHPSTEEFDSGVDDLANPKWYIVWGTHMNTHIIPEYVVSFKCSKRTRGQVPICPSNRAVRTCPPMPVSFLKVLEELRRRLPATMLPALDIAHSRYKGGKIQKDAFIKCLRRIAGDKLLGSIIRKTRGYY